jgi:peptidoglycan/LPS O-acetylase OafA/YrhL
MLGHGLIAFDFALYTGDPAQSHASSDVWLSGAPFQVPIAGNLAVCLFFAMSGFVLVGAFEAASTGFVPLLVKRYTRLAIPVISACLLSYFALSAGWMDNQQVVAVSRSSWLGSQFHQSPSIIQAAWEGATALGRSVGFSSTYDSSLWTMPLEFAGSIGVLLMCVAAKSITGDVAARRTIYIIVASALYLALA